MDSVRGGGEFSISFLLLFLYDSSEKGYKDPCINERLEFEQIHSNPESDSNSTTKATSTATSTLASRNKAADGETGSS